MSIDYLISPNPDDPRLTERVEGLDHEGQRIETSVTVERPLTLFLNGQEIVTMMTIGDYPEYLALGYLLNQNMIHEDDSITAIIKTFTTHTNCTISKAGTRESDILFCSDFNTTILSSENNVISC